MKTRWDNSVDNYQEYATCWILLYNGLERSYHNGLERSYHNTGQSRYHPALWHEPSWCNIYTCFSFMAWLCKVQSPLNSHWRLWEREHLASHIRYLAPVAKVNGDRCGSVPILLFITGFDVTYWCSITAVCNDGIQVGKENVDKWENVSESGSCLQGCL